MLMYKHLFLLLQTVFITMLASTDECSVNDTAFLMQKGHRYVDRSLRFPFTDNWRTVDLIKGMDTLVVSFEEKNENIDPLGGLRENLPRTGLSELGPCFHSIFGQDADWKPACYQGLLSPLDTLDSKLRFLASAAEPMTAMARCLKFLENMDSRGGFGDSQDKDNVQKAKETLMQSLSSLKQQLGLSSPVERGASLEFIWKEGQEKRTSDGLPGYEVLWTYPVWVSSLLTEEQRVLFAQIVQNFAASAYGSPVGFAEHLLGEGDPLRHLLARVFGLFYYNTLPNLLKRMAIIGKAHVSTVQKAWSGWQRQLEWLYLSLDPTKFFYHSRYWGTGVHRGEFDESDACYWSDEPGSEQIAEWFSLLHSLKSISSFEAQCLQDVLDARFPGKYPDQVVEEIQKLPYASQITVK